MMTVWFLLALSATFLGISWGLGRRGEYRQAAAFSMTGTVVAILAMLTALAITVTR